MLPNERKTYRDNRKKKVGKEAKKKAIYRYEILDIKKCEIIHS